MSLVACLAPSTDVVVGGARVVRHRVAGLHAKLFEIERVPCGDLGRRLRAVEQPDGLLGAAVHRVDELQVLHRVVVFGLGFDEELLHRRRVGIAPGLRQRHGRRMIGQQVDGVLRRRGDVLAGRTVELDAIEAVLLRRELRRQRAVGVGGERHALVLAHHQASTLRRHGRRDRHLHLGASQHGDVAAVFNRSRLQLRVRREAILEVELLDVRQLDHLQREHRRANARRLDDVVHRLGQVEEHAFVAAALGLHHRHALEGRRARLARQDRRFGGIEPVHRRVDRLVRALGHRGVARRDVDAIRRRCLDVAGDVEQRRERVAQIRRTEA